MHHIFYKMIHQGNVFFAWIRYFFAKQRHVHINPKRLTYLFYMEYKISIVAVAHFVLRHEILFCLLIYRYILLCSVELEHSKIVCTF
jgi:hypothetical protein